VLDFPIHFSSDLRTDSLTQVYPNDFEPDCLICYVLPGYWTYSAQDWDCVPGCRIYSAVSGWLTCCEVEYRIYFGGDWRIRYADSLIREHHLGMDSENARFQDLQIYWELEG